MSVKFSIVIIYFYTKTEYSKDDVKERSGEIFDRRRKEKWVETGEVDINGRHKVSVP